MDRYDVLVQWETGAGINLSSAVSQPIQVTNGRSDLSSVIGQCYASVTFLKSDLFALVEAAGYSRTAFSFGSLVTIQVRDEGSTSPRKKLFQGNVTDNSSDAYEITFTMVADLIYQSSGALPQTAIGPTADTFIFLVAGTIQDSIGAGKLTSSIVSRAQVDIYSGTTVEYQNPLTFLSPIINNAPSVFMFVDPNQGKLVINSRPKASAYVPIVIGSSDVFLNYSLDRSVEDVANSVTVNYSGFPPYAGGTYSKNNPTSIAKIGTRFVEINTQIIDPPDAVTLATWYLGAHAPAGYPIVTFTTTAELLGMSSVDLAEKLIPDAYLDLTGINEEGFDDYAFVEQTRHTLTRSQWRIEITASNADYSLLTQTWAEVTPTLKWDDIVNDPPDTVTWDDLLYTSL